MMFTDKNAVHISSKSPRLMLLIASFVSATIIGAVVGLFTVYFVKLIMFAEVLRIQYRPDTSYPSFELFFYQACLLFLGMCILIVMRRIFRIHRWHGPADVIHAAHSNLNVLSTNTGIATILSVFFSVAAGASVGIYGPLVHLGAFLSRAYNSVFRINLLSQDMILGCGVAAAISSGFNAPIAGMIFAHEVVLRHFSMRALAPIAIASIASFSISSGLFDEVRWLRLDTNVPSIFSLSPGILVSGLFFGMVAVLITRLQIGLSRKAGKSGLADWQLGLMAVVICAFIGLFVPEALGLGSTALLDMLSLEFGLTTLFILLLSKIILTAASTCLGFSLGIFSPSLFIGAAAGGTIGHLLHLVGIPVSLPIIMVCGMAALSGAITGAPIAILVIIIEMTMSYDLAVATMLAVGTCTLITFCFGGNSLFDQQLKMRNIDISRGRVGLLLLEGTIDRHVTNEYMTLDINTSSEIAAKALAVRGYSEGYCLTAAGNFIGKIKLQDLVNSPEKNTLEKLLNKNPTSINLGTSIENAREIASTFIGEAIPVINQETNEMVGVVSEADIFRAVLDIQNSVTVLERN